MTISYNWLCDYLPERPDPETLSSILTSIGLEVESLEKYEAIRGGLQGLLVGEVLECVKHPDADKLSLTKVNIGQAEPLRIVCGAPNVAAGQKVIVAPVGSTIYPAGGEPLKMKKAKIRGAESEGMICAEDEIGIGTSHAGIMILDPSIPAGTAAASLFDTYEDYIFEIGLTPNRMDAMSHLGVARDVCAWMSHHHQKRLAANTPLENTDANKGTGSPIQVIIENTEACRRYSGVLIEGITVKESPAWLQKKLKSIGVRPINNIVDITNFILHETGQPLHAFDADQVAGKTVIVKNLADKTPFITLDDKERKLSSADLMICNASEPMCIAGVYGGKKSGVSAETKNIFLESAWFSPVSIRKTSLLHELRTDAASRFEKGTDISQTLNVLARAARLITETAGGSISGDLIDVYPSPLPKKTVRLEFDYLKKLSGKDYPAAAVSGILQALGFSLISENEAGIDIAVPYSKTDISIPADIVEEIMRIDGLDNITIPSRISLSPSTEKDGGRATWQEKIAHYLTGLGFSEIFTNSISNSAFYSDAILKDSVRMINNLSAELDIMRPEMLPSGLQSIAHNLNRKNESLFFFEFGHTYQKKEKGFDETKRLAIYATGMLHEAHWRQKPTRADYYYIKGLVENLMALCGIRKWSMEETRDNSGALRVQLTSGQKKIGVLGEVPADELRKFDIRQPVCYADLLAEELFGLSVTGARYREIPRFPAVNRDLALVVDKNVSYSELEKIALTSGIAQLADVGLFDVFESDRLGLGKKSMALSFVFLDEQKTLTDKEIEGFMQQLVQQYEQKLNAEIRK